MTTGVDILGALLTADADLLALVPIDQMKAGALPDSPNLPQLLVRCTSSVERLTLKRGSTTRTVDRVSVAVRAASYDDQREVIRLVKLCCAGKTGNIGEGSNVSILTDHTGPDIRGPGDTFEQTYDFKVSYDAS